MSSKLQGKVALVTGSGRGIGRAIAMKLAGEGARVVINDLDAAPAEETVRDIRAAGGEAVACVGSVAAPDFAERSYGLIKTRRTGSAGDGATAQIDGREIKVGVNPGLLATMEQAIPLGRGGTPEEAAGAVYLLCIPESDYISGQTLMCSGGLTGI